LESAKSRYPYIKISYKNLTVNKKIR